MVEETLVNMAQRGQISSKLGEEELIRLLESINQQTQRKTIVKVSIGKGGECTYARDKKSREINERARDGTFFSSTEEEQLWILTTTYSNQDGGKEEHKT